jgi:hypothetical protein
MDEQTLAAYVGALKDAYTVKMQLLDSSFELPGSSAADKKWSVLATLLADRGLNPFGYIQFVFDFCGEHLDGFYMNVVASERMVEQYRRKLPEHNAKLEESVAYQIEHVRDRLGNGECLDGILNDPNAPVNVAVRLAMAAALSRDDLVKQFEADAKYLLVFEPHLKVLLGKWLPKEFLT